MGENKSSILAIIAVIIAASGLGVGAYSIFIEGPPGQDGTNGLDGLDGTDGLNGTDGIDGIDAPGGIVVGVLEPDQGEIVSGNVTIRALISGSDSYTVQVLINGWLNATYVPFQWNTLKVSDGLWNITVIATDVGSNNVSQNVVIVYVKNPSDTNIYYCSSQSEIELALSSIGTGHGTIMITEDITLTSTINLDDGGSYVIQGVGSITIDRNADDETFSITNTQSCIIRDLMIDASDLTGENRAISIIDYNTNLLHIENVKVYGDGGGYGIYVVSYDVSINNCDFYNLTSGIYANSAHRHRFTGNLIQYMTEHGILAFTSIESVITDNIIRYCYDGIEIRHCYLTTVSNNVIRNIGRYGIYISGYGCTFTGNSIAYDNFVNNADVYGIFVASFYYYNTIVGNVISLIDADGTGTGYGMTINGDNNTVVGNTLYDNDDNTINDFGLNNVIEHNIEG